MGEETDITESMSSENVVAPEEVTADEPSKHRKRKKLLYKSLRELMEFYLGDVNLSKDRFMSQHIQGQPFVYVDLSLFLTFNKIKALTSNVEDLAKAVSTSDILQVSEDGTQVCRKTPIMRKENEDDCTIYVEQLGPDVDHDTLTKVFSEYGFVDYVSLPRFSYNSKFKGFGFVEFRDPESAKRALEAFRMKGCCLSPHIAPEELMSIKNFDNSIENKDVEKKVEKKDSNNKLDDGCDLEAEETNTTEKSSVDRKDHFNKGKKKRKSFEEGELPKKKMKCNSNDNSRPLVSCKKNDPAKQREGESSEELEINNRLLLKDELTSKGREKKSQANPPEETVEELFVNLKEEENEKKTEKKKQKRKHSDEVLDKSDTDKCNVEEDEPVKKKPKSDTEETEVSKSEGETCEDGAIKQKKKRKRKKKMKEDKSAITFGLRVLPKKEWKQLRNKYLNMQREMMRTLKQQLMYSKWERSKSMAPDAEEESTKEVKEAVIPGTIVKVILDQPVSNCKTAKSEMRVHPEIKYVDVHEGNVCVYLRTTTPHIATSIVQARHWSNMQVIQGDEETSYWNKMKMDREEHLKKNKSSHQRGRTKLLKRAEKFQGKHITTFESSQS